MLTSTNVKSALVSAVIAAVLGTAGYILSVGDFFSLNLHTMANVAGLSALVTLVSLLKSAMTSSQGTIAGIQVK